MAADLVAPPVQVGDVVADPVGVRRAIGYMPDNFGVYDGMRVWEFLDFFAVAYRIGRTERKRIIANVVIVITVGIFLALDPGLYRRGVLHTGGRMKLRQALRG